MSKNKNGARLKIDRKAFKECIEQLGTPEEVAERIGYAEGTLRGVFSSNYISRPMATALDYICGIKYEYYKPKEKEQPKPSIVYEVEDPIERILIMILQELQSMNERRAK